MTVFRSCGFSHLPQHFRGSLMLSRASEPHCLSGCHPMLICSSPDGPWSPFSSPLTAVNNTAVSSAVCASESLFWILWGMYFRAELLGRMATVCCTFRGIAKPVFLVSTYTGCTHGVWSSTVALSPAGVEGRALWIKARACSSVRPPKRCSLLFSCASCIT